MIEIYSKIEDQRPEKPKIQVVRVYNEGRALESLLYFLRMPFDKTMERVLELTMAHAPAKHTVASSLLERIQFIVTTVLMIPTIPFTILSYSLAALVDAFNPARFTYWEGKGAEKESVPKVLMTWNVCALFGGLCIRFGGVAPIDKRVDEIAQTIIRKNPDVVCLQEVSQPAAHLLFGALKDDYRHIYHVNHDPLMLGSAIMVASKHRLESFEVTSLPRGGALKKELVTFKIGNLSVGTAHLQAGLGAQDAASRAVQVAKILENPPQIFLGDMNAKFSETRLGTVYQNTLLRDVPTATDAFIGKPWRDQVDYIVAEAPLQVETEIGEAYQEGEWAMSDHHFLTGKLRG